MQSRPSEFTSLLQGFRRTISTEGTLALWKGWQATLTGMMMENAAAFGVNEQLKRLFPDPLPGESTAFQRFMHPLMIGAFTGVPSGLALCPADK